MEMATPSAWLYGRSCVFERIFGLSAFGLSTLSLPFTNATNIGHDACSHRRNLPAETRLPTFLPTA